MKIVWGIFHTWIKCTNVLMSIYMDRHANLQEGLKIHRIQQGSHIMKKANSLYKEAAVQYLHGQAFQFDQQHKISQRTDTR